MAKWANPFRDYNLKWILRHHRYRGYPYQRTLPKRFERGWSNRCEKEKIDNARKMKECGVDIHIISTVTGLSADEIEKLW